MSAWSRRTSPRESIESIQLFTSDRRTDTSLLDLIDNLLNNGVVLQGELVLGVANVDLIYVHLSLLLSAVDRVFGPQPSAKRSRRTRRRRRATESS